MSIHIQAPYQLSFAEDHDHRALLQAYIQHEYGRQFNALIPHFLPYLLGMYRADGVLVGACGLNRADNAPLYLERYLDAPIEEVVATQTGTILPRNRLVEIGNFACSESGNARIMFAAICRLLCENQLDYVAFTGTKKLRNIFHRLHLTPLELAPALPDRMGEDAQAWGEYYQGQPCVMVGDLKQGRQILSETSLLLSLFGPMPDIFPVQMSVQL
ncbi:MULTISPECIES: thermostable hemolysin [Serratia]|uniref:Thermostable hemolysin n=1 Tax=Serratia fonticola TaxID=47917 RepID=A0AAP7K904_SERFO|nr:MULTISPECIES: thermostable hemolysin [Serratia]ERK09994.1 Thermostable hemolysin delta-VPH [Serratia fonticola AU-AP2C]ALX96912.1 thermostable hemolysin [Serratia fonticola]MBC3215597.1 thermostable hemolysin [Serratia fonticola]MBP1037975.1 thermostable hemolysin [Serratia fonticola]NYA14202.1 thermostable hemolysin [Serratia fonticola]